MILLVPCNKLILMEQLYKSLPALIAIPSAPNFAMTRQWQSWREVITVCTRKESCNFRLLVDRRLSGLPKGPQFRENSEMGGGVCVVGLQCRVEGRVGQPQRDVTRDGLWRHRGAELSSNDWFSLHKTKKFFATFSGKWKVTQTFYS